jgi:hypothetical protein
MKTWIAFVASVLVGGAANRAFAATAPPRPLGRRTMKRLLAGTAVLTSAMLIAAPVNAAGRGGHGGGFHGGGFHGGRGSHGSRPGFHHGGVHRFGCCLGPAFVGGVFVGSALAYPYYAYPYYGYPYTDPGYSAYPVYSGAVYQSQAQVSVAPSVQREVCYVGGCYRLQGDGVSVPYQWAWVPVVPAPPPGPPGR